jgi:prefoldin subunit 5
MGILSFISNWLFLLVIFAVGLVCFIYVLRFFKKATEYYQSELNDRTTKHEQMNELLAKLDQLVDVLKVK